MFKGLFAIITLRNCTFRAFLLIKVRAILFLFGLYDLLHRPTLKVMCIGLRSMCVLMRCCGCGKWVKTHPWQMPCHAVTLFVFQAVLCIGATLNWIKSRQHILTGPDERHYRRKMLIITISYSTTATSISPTGKTSKYSLLLSSASKPSGLMDHYGSNKRKH